MLFTVFFGDEGKSLLVRDLLIFNFGFSFIFDRTTLPFLSIVVIDVAILAHASCIEFLMGTVPGFFGSAKFMVAIVAHSLGIMLSIIVPTFIDFLPK